MEGFLTEHGSVIVSGVMSIFTIALFFMVVFAASNMNALVLSTIIGE